MDISDISGNIFAGFPYSDVGYLVRNITGLDLNNKAIRISEIVNEGLEIFFVKKDLRFSKDDLINTLNNLKFDIGDNNIKGILYISCLGRKVSFNDEFKEIEYINDIIGNNVPIVGYRANGEIYKSHIHGYTAIISAFY